MTINERLREVLFELDKNAKELAHELKVTPTTISKTLKGDTLPSSKLLIPLGEKLGISIDWLLFGKRDMFIDSHAQDYPRPAPNSDNNNNNINLIDKERIKHLEQQIKLLTLTIEDKNKRIEDKEELIKLLKNVKNS